MPSYSTHNYTFGVNFPQHPGVQGRPSTPTPSRKVSFDECANIKDDIDVTSRFLTSHYITCCIRYDSPRPSFPRVSKSSPCTAPRGTKKPPAKRGMISKHTLTRHSRSGCLRQLDEESGSSEKRCPNHFSGRAIPSVSEDDMTLTLGSASDCAMSMSHLNRSLSSASASASSSSPSHQEYEQDDTHLGFGWGYFVDVLPSDLELKRRERKSLEKKVPRSSLKRHIMTNKNLRYCPHSFTTGKPSTHSSTNDISAGMNNISL